MLPWGTASMIWIAVIWRLHHRRLHGLLARVSEIEWATGRQPGGRCAMTHKTTPMRSSSHSNCGFQMGASTTTSLPWLYTRFLLVAIEELGEMLPMDSSHNIKRGKMRHA